MAAARRGIPLSVMALGVLALVLAVFAAEIAWLADG
jgi:hypothetical protein